MQKRKEHHDLDADELAHRLVQLSTAGVAAPAATPATPDPLVTEFPQDLSEYMAAIGWRGGRIGGKQRLNTMSAKRRRGVAVKAARTRWSTTKNVKAGEA
jgi:hypothetical protein